MRGGHRLDEVRLEARLDRSLNKERLDFSCAIFDPDGMLVANAPHIPIHLGSMSESVRTVIPDNAGRMKPGDVFCVNAPYNGGTHLPDVTVITPVFDDSGTGARILFFVASRGHHADIGGSIPGSMPPDARTVEEEGILFDNFMLVDGGRFLESELRVHLGSGRWPARNPDQDVADLKAQIAAGEKGIQEVRWMIEDFGLDVVHAYMRHVQDNAEEQVRRMIDVMRDGGFELPMNDGSVIRVRRRLHGGAPIIRSRYTLQPAQQLFGAFAFEDPDPGFRGPMGVAHLLQPFLDSICRSPIELPGRLPVYQLDLTLFLPLPGPLRHPFSQHVVSPGRVPDSHQHFLPQIHLPGPLPECALQVLVPRSRQAPPQRIERSHHLLGTPAALQPNERRDQVLVLRTRRLEACTVARIQHEVSLRRLKGRQLGPDRRKQIRHVLRRRPRMPAIVEHDRKHRWERAGTGACQVLVQQRRVGQDAQRHRPVHDRLELQQHQHVEPPVAEPNPPHPILVTLAEIVADAAVGPTLQSREIELGDPVPRHESDQQVAHHFREREQQLVRGVEPGRWR